ncbi:hypothetical protein CMEL01_10454 [Colletotrichum melonis]|uniref:Uncharacterized protein n=1 Tax=Colletotrichum melonis TaxID=1209925 RepID=A0AAI9XDZ2_9PEZI|nr:hypothetical protein CMEL01_10454 [Colletotrichum melonis]
MGSCLPRLFLAAAQVLTPKRDVCSHIHTHTRTLKVFLSSSHHLPCCRIVEVTNSSITSQGPRLPSSTNSAKALRTGRYKADHCLVTGSLSLSIRENKLAPIPIEARAARYPQKPSSTRFP